MLLRERLLPVVISGSSAGAIMAAVLGSKTDAELRKVLVPSAPGIRFDMIRPMPKVRPACRCGLNVCVRGASLLLPPNVASSNKWCFSKCCFRYI